METLLLVVLYLLAAYLWVWLASVSDREVPLAILLQQRLGRSTRRGLYQFAGRGRWLAVGGLAAAATGFLPGFGMATAVGLLVVAVGSLGYVHVGMANLLEPRLVKAILGRMEGGEPDPPVAA
jgi:hypothetical protein